jgi:hypothetical protein
MIGHTFNKGYALSKEHNQKISVGGKGKHWTQEQHDNICKDDNPSPRLKEKRRRESETREMKRIGAYERKLAEGVYWSEKQVDSLIKGVQTYGGGKWKKLKMMGWPGLDGFSNQQLGGKWGRLVKAKDPRIEGLYK